MKKLKKLLVALLAATLMVSALPLSASAAAIENEVMPLWDNTNQFYTQVTFNNGYGRVSPLIIGKSGVTNISVDIKIYCIDNDDEIFIDGTYESVESGQMGFEFDFPANYGSTYRVDYTVIVTKDGIDERIDDFDIESYT